MTPAALCRSRRQAINSAAWRLARGSYLRWEILRDQMAAAIAAGATLEQAWERARLEIHHLRTLEGRSAYG
jgi:hypothetical protein